MTKDEILAMEPGRELDILVGTKVMEWTMGSDGIYHDATMLRSVNEYPFSRELNAAFEVQEKMREYGLYLILTNLPESNKFACEFVTLFCTNRVKTGIGIIAPNFAVGRKPAEAICKSSLLVQYIRGCLMPEPIKQ